MLERCFKFQHSTDIPCFVKVNYRLGRLRLKRLVSSRVIEDFPLSTHQNLRLNDREWLASGTAGFGTFYMRTRLGYLIAGIFRNENGFRSYLDIARRADLSIVFWFDYPHPSSCSHHSSGMSTTLTVYPSRKFLISYLFSDGLMPYSPVQSTRHLRYVHSDPAPPVMASLTTSMSTNDTP